MARRKIGLCGRCAFRQGVRLLKQLVRVGRHPFPRIGQRGTAPLVRQLSNNLGNGTRRRLAHDRGRRAGSKHELNFDRAGAARINIRRGKNFSEADLVRRRNSPGNVHLQLLAADIIPPKPDVCIFFAPRRRSRNRRTPGWHHACTAAPSEFLRSRKIRRWR
jgi:hypothetical protein